MYKHTQLRESVTLFLHFCRNTIYSLIERASTTRFKEKKSSKIALSSKNQKYNNTSERVQLHYGMIPVELKVS